MIVAISDVRITNGSLYCSMTVFVLIWEKDGVNELVVLPKDYISHQPENGEFDVSCSVTTKYPLGTSSVYLSLKGSI